MKLKYVIIIFLFIISKTFSQEKEKVLFTINNEPFYTHEFLKVYKKNQTLMPSSEENSIETYLNLFVTYKLKVKEAKDLKLDTLPKFRRELNTYKSKLILPYLKDEQTTEKLVNEAYERLQKEVEVSHILINLKPNYTFSDTLEAYNKLLQARDLVLKGSSFSEVAKKYSEDPTVSQNNGNIGYFTALQMVYPFENIAYSTPISEISMPFRTKFGYHILKVHNIRKARGEVEVAHIMIEGDTGKSKTTIDSIYKELVINKTNFENIATKLSEDRASAVNGGKLPKFGTGQMIEEFTDMAFSLTNENTISKPFKTPFGWHIIKLIKKYPLESFDKLKSKIRQQIEKDERSKLIEKSLINKLSKLYAINVNKNALRQFQIDDWKNNNKNFQKLLLTIETKEINQLKFINYLKRNNLSDIYIAFSLFKENEILNYYKENIEKTNAEFAAIFKEFKEGLLLFDLLEKKVWTKSKENEGLIHFYALHKEDKYKNKAFENIKGIVITDYQNELEKIWINELHKKYNVKFNNSEKKKILKTNFK
ncbi:peptidylprolyl isomerase [uncultured Lutibacter sp.]|uniref:peptidylprolyl isomerase n=1 Tax=uncultured Lutibacter sp. TaxID=437739 RepID=UPI002602ED57|nr:peptidylprolyl isomerase [uncultured Lutibacter sp.]